MRRHRDQICKVRTLLVLHLCDLDPALLGEHRRVYVIHFFFEHGIEHALDHRRRQQPRIDFCDLTVVRNIEPLNGTVGKRTDRSAQSFSQVEIRRNDPHYLLRHRRHVHRRRHRLTVERRADPFGDVERHANLRLDGRRAQMRSQHHIFAPDQRMIAWNRFVDKHIDRRARHNTFVERRRQILFVDDPAARTIDQPHARLHSFHLRHRDHVLGVRRQRHVHRDEIRALDQLVERAYLDAQIVRTLLTQVRIISDDLHAERDRSFRNARSDPPHADHSERLALELHAHEFFPIPTSLVHALIRRRDMPRHRQHHRQRVFGRRYRVAARRVDHYDPARRRRIQINIVDAHARSPYDLQLLRTLDHVGAHL